MVILTALVLALAPSVHAFDPKSGLQVGWMPETCFKGGWNENKRSEVNAAVNKWLNAVTNLGLEHHPSPDFPCDLLYTQLKWVLTLDGDFARADGAAQYINFAERDGNLEPFDWNISPTPPEDPPDLRAVAVHELGHVIGLHHPENSDSYPWKSWDGEPPTMVASMPNDEYAPGRTLELDDIAGGYWMKDRQWVALPEMGSDAIQYWETGAGTLTSCNTAWACLWNGPSNAQYTFRFTVDGRDERRTPAIKVWWMRDGGANGTMQLELQTRNVQSNAAGGGVGSWSVSSGPVCSASASSWATCAWNPTFPSSQVRDVRLVIRNQTDGMIKIERVEAYDG